MVKVFMGDENEVGLGEGGIINDLIVVFAHGIDFNLFSIELNPDAGMSQRMDPDSFPVGSEKGVGLVSVVRCLGLSTGSQQTENNREKYFFHSLWICFLLRRKNTKYITI